MKMTKLLASAFLLCAVPMIITPAVRAKSEPAATLKSTENIEIRTYQYATTGGQKLYLDRIVDVSHSSATKRPVLIYSFGGGWETGTRNEPVPRSFLTHFAKRGYTVIAIDYRLAIKDAKASGEFTPDKAVSLYQRAIDWGVEDLYDATAFVLRNADEWMIDPDQVIIVGSSAGATNSLVAEYYRANQTELATKHLPENFRYAGVIAMAGAFWIKPGLPLTFKTTPAPFMFFHGAKDQLVTYDEAQYVIAAYGPVAFQRKYPNGDVPSWFVDVPEADHVMSFAPMIDYRFEIEAFLDKMVKQKQKMVIRSVEKDQVSKTFGNLITLYGAYLTQESGSKR